MFKQIFIFFFFLTSTLYVTAGKNKKLSQDQVIALVQKFEKDNNLKEVELVNLKNVTEQLKTYKQHIKHHQKQLTDLIGKLYQFSEYTKGAAILAAPSAPQNLWQTLSVVGHLNKTMTTQKKNLLSFFQKYLILHKKHTESIKKIQEIETRKLTRNALIEKIQSLFSEDLVFIKAVENAIKQSKASELSEILRALLTLKLTDGEEVNLNLMRPLNSPLNMVLTGANLTQGKSLAAEDSFCKTPMDAIVVYSGTISGRNALILQYNPFQIVFWGLDNTYCKVGDLIKPGLPLAWVVKDSEVVFELYKDGVNIDPLPYMSF
ncbi:MAG TPA: hypothetical protein DIC42_03585 [Holosporales bacterium]|nr:hypothetical protein [Holosporales bacterium]